MENSNKSKGELVYESLLLRDDVSKEVIEQPFFKENFISAYDSIENRSIELNVVNGEISLTVSGNFPNAINGEYTGFNEIESISFSIEKIPSVDEDYLCVRRNGCTVYSFPEYDSVNRNKYLQVYNDREQLADAHISRNVKSYSRTMPYIDASMPQIDMAFAMSGVTDLSAQKRLEHGDAQYVDFQMEYSGRVAGDGVVTSSRVSRKNGNYEISHGYSSVNLERPQYLSNRSSEFVTYDDLNQKLVYLDSRYSDVREAIVAYNESYLESLEESRSR